MDSSLLGNVIFTLITYLALAIPLYPLYHLLNHRVANRDIWLMLIIFAPVFGPLYYWMKIIAKGDFQGK